MFLLSLKLLRHNPFGFALWGELQNSNEDFILQDWNSNVELSYSAEELKLNPQSELLNEKKNGN
jgi:hypothetical protein